MPSILNLGTMYFVLCQFSYQQLILCQFHVVLQAIFYLLIFYEILYSYFHVINQLMY